MMNVQKIKPVLEVNAEIPVWIILVAETLSAQWLIIESVATAHLGSKDILPSPVKRVSGRKY